MKNALILHGTGGNSHENWFPWLESKLIHEGYKVWVPDLPEADKPDIKRYYSHILIRSNFHLNRSTLMVGHSSGAVAILGLLDALPAETKVDTCILVGSFKDDLGWDGLSELFLKPFNFDKIKNKARKFIFIHSDNDPYCPLEHAQYLSAKVSGKLYVIPGQKHFSVSTYGKKYRRFPKLMEIITDNLLK